jgi:hypothetical protein
MNALMCLAAALALAVGFSLTAPDRANAGCAVWRPCAPAVLVPAPNPIPLHKVRIRRAAPCGVGCAPVVAAPCVTGCGRVAVAPVAPCVAPCGAASFWYQPTRFWAKRSGRIDLAQQRERARRNLSASR